VALFESQRYSSPGRPDLASWGLITSTPDGVVQPSSSTLRPYGRGGRRYKIGRKLEGGGDPAQVWIYQLPGHQAGETMNAIKIGILVMGAVAIGIAVLVDATKDHATREGTITRVDDLISQEEVLNEKCRGSSGDLAETQKFCEERDAIFAQIKSRGWCWGTGNEIEAEKKWQSCPSQTNVSPLEQYLLDIRMATVPLAQAHAAAMCGLRSDQWMSAFDLNYQMQAHSEAKRLGISSAGITRGDKETAKMYQETMSMTSCRALINSPAMAHLDDLQSQMTGGYH
jgi:hypothetical protein